VFLTDSGMACALPLECAQLNVDAGTAFLSRKSSAQIKSFQIPRDGLALIDTTRKQLFNKDCHLITGEIIHVVDEISRACERCRRAFDIGRTRRGQRVLALLLLRPSFADDILCACRGSTGLQYLRATDGQLCPTDGVPAARDNDTGYGNAAGDCGPPLQPLATDPTAT